MLPKLHIHWERWKYNKTFEVYVSTLGNVRNKSKASLAPKIGYNGYVLIPVQGSKPGYMLLHRLVLLTWRPTPEAEILTVDHLNHNKRDNSLDNLEWVTFEENQRRAKEDLASKEINLESGLSHCVPNSPKYVVTGVLVTDSKKQTATIGEYKNAEELAQIIAQLHIEYGFNPTKFATYVEDIKSQHINVKQQKSYCGLILQAIYHKE